MTTHPPILRNSALSLPLVIVVGFIMSQPAGIGAAITGVFMLANLWVFSILGPRIVQAVATGESVALWSAGLGAKSLLLLGGVYGLLTLFPPEGVALGLVTLMLGTMLTALQLARQPLPEVVDSFPMAPPSAPPTET